jgi:type IV pilus assembly protein PilY1
MHTQRKTLMATARIAVTALLVGWMLSPFRADAQDIDIYSGLTNATGAPNVLFILDNAANFTSNYSGTACTYVDTGGLSSLGSGTSGSPAVNGSMEQCALNNVVATLPTNSDGTARVNIGIMVYNGGGIPTSSGGACNGGKGGCLLYPITPMTSTNKATLLTYIKSWSKSAIGSNNEKTAQTMEEAYAYLHGTTGPSTVSYTSPLSTSGCQKTYVVFIANALDTNGTPGDGSSASPGADLSADVTTNSALTSAQKTIYAPGTVQVPSGTYGITGVYACSPNPYVMPNHTESSGLYADEWSRYLYGTDILTGAMPANKNVITYSIGVLSSSCRADYPALLTSMAAQGGGKYFAVQNAADLANALNSILNEVQAVNSVFSSATLPVSVNTQGTYLNQIYMGMFRPDPNALPRWVGNVKQYQFQFDQNMNLYLADATKQPALSSSGTGFISTEAASFWSCTNSTHASTMSGPPAPYTPYSSLPTCSADPSIGYWVNNFNYATFSAGGAFDLMDGEIVEKGGAGQSLRLENLNDDYTATAGTSTNPRRLYTYCPGGSGCVADLTNSANAFAPTNTTIPTTAFGGSSSIILASLTRSGTTATATTVSPHGWTSGQTVTISGASPSQYNGTFTITVTSSTTFTYPIVEYPPSPATGSYQVQAHQPVIAVSGITRTHTSGANPSPANQETATVTTTAPHGYTTGNSVVISGGSSNENAYNGLHTITVTGATTFTYPVAITPPTPAANTYRVALHSPIAITISTISLSGSTATITTATAHGFHTNDLIQIGNTSNTCFNTAGATITVTSSTTFTMSGVSGCGGNKTSTGGSATPVAAPETIASLTRTGTTNTATATATLNASQFATGDIVDITYVSGTATNEIRYLGTYTITCSAYPCTTFTYQVSVGPVYPATSTFSSSLASGPVNVTSLTRVGTTATAALASAPPAFTSGALLDVFAASGTTPPATESAYQGTYTATCDPVLGCTQVTYGPINLSPTSPASGTITAVNPSQPPDATTLINWVRGEDNAGDEASMCPPGTATGSGNCPSPRVTVRPSVHGDALHSRPIAVNYGGTTGVVVYYGTNDGVYHAINGNQSTSIGSVPPGGELWGFIASDFFAKLERQRANLPQILLPGTPSGISPTPQPKDYFIDGPTGLLQEIDGAGNNVNVIIYVGARRGGHMLLALDVKDPLTPKFLWKIDNSSSNMGELGQTWSLPKVARVNGYTDSTGTPSPVIIMGGGYDDGAEDAEPPVSATPNGGGVDMGSDNTGRAVFVLDAFTGATIWQMNHYNLTATAYPWFWTRLAGGSNNGQQGGFCNGTPPAPVTCDVVAMNYSIPADVTLIDKNGDGLIDRLYATDTGGNVWRVDLEPAAGNTPDKWQITQLAALGCNWGPCDTTLMPSGTAPNAPFPSAQNPASTQRKFFFPAEVIGATSLNNYDAVFVGSGDREHPLQSQQAYNVVNRMYMIKDFNTGNDSVSQIYPITEGGANTTSGASTVPASLADCTGGTCITAPSAWPNAGTATTSTYDKLTAIQQGSGYYFTLGTGEKVVNAPLETAGFIYFGTNQPAPASTTSTCTTNLGIARGYQLSPFSAQYASVVFAGGGLPPSPVSGIVNISTASGTVSAPFCVGCPSALTGGTSNCNTSALAACKPTINVPAIRHRNYWYMDNR